MKRLFCVIFALLLLLTGCSAAPDDNGTPSNTDSGEHSVYYADRVSVDKMAYYFNDVCFGNEYGATKSIITKWQDPIMYYIDGTVSMNDYEVINGFIDFLNNIDGFPGIMEIHDKSQANLVLHFYGLAQFKNEVDTEGAAGLATFNYNNNTGVITDGDVYICTDEPESERKSIILEEMYQVLGPTKDTLVRKDSIIYQRGNAPQLSKEDKSIISLLYSSRITPGMSMAESEEIIREIYY